MFTDVTDWWVFISAVSVINIILWLVSAVVLRLRKPFIDLQIFRWRQVIFWLSGIYVWVCAYRSFYPRIDLERICLVDSMFSSMFVGRSVTTIAEISFMLQCAILLYEIGKKLDSRFAVQVALSLVPLVVIAELFSWYAILSTNYFGSVIEESIWTLCGVLLVVSFILLWPRVLAHHRKYLATIIMFGIGFIMFMVTIDVPMYWQRWQADTAAGIEYLSLSQGVIDSIKSYNVNYDMAIWRDEIPWMTLYFTVAVWVSISLTHTPNYSRFRKP